MIASLRAAARKFPRWFHSPAVPARAAKLNLLQLEARDTPTVVALVWTGAGNGVYWSDPDNWAEFDFDTAQLTTHRTPTSGDTLYFGALGGANTSSVANISATVHEIIQANTYTGGLMIEDGVTVTTSTTLTAYGDLLIEEGGVLSSPSIFTYGTVEVEGGGYVAIISEQLVMEGGSQLLTTTLSVELEIDNVSMAVGSSWFVGSMITVTLDGSVGSSGTINLAGESGGGLTVTGDFSSSGDLNMFNGSVLEVEGSAPVLLQGETTIVGGAAILADTLLMNAGTLLLDVDGVGNSGLFVSGDFELDAGTLTFADIVGTLTVGGNFSVFIATINMNVATNGLGGVGIAGASNTISVGGSVTIDAPLPGATLNLNSVNGPIAAGDFFDVITITGSGTGSGVFGTVSPTPVAHGWLVGFLTYRVQY